MPTLIIKTIEVLNVQKAISLLQEKELPTDLIFKLLLINKELNDICESFEQIRQKIVDKYNTSDNGHIDLGTNEAEAQKEIDLILFESHSIEVSKLLTEKDFNNLNLKLSVLLSLQPILKIE